MAAALLVVAVLLLAATAWRLTWQTRRATREAEVAGRRHTAHLELGAARADATRITARLTATLTAHADTVGRGGFGDTHLRAARLRAALADTPEETS